MMKLKTKSSKTFNVEGFKIIYIGQAKHGALSGLAYQNLKKSSNTWA